MLCTPTTTPTIAAEDSITPTLVSDFEDDDNNEYYDEEDEYSLRNDDDNALQNAGSGSNRVRIVGGVYVGKMGTFVKYTQKKIAVVIDGVIPPTIRYLSIPFLEFINHNNNHASTRQQSSTIPQTRPPTNTTTQQELKVGHYVNVIGGTYRGQSGQIQKLTPQRVVVILDEDDLRISHYLHKKNVAVVLQTNSSTHRNERSSGSNDILSGERIQTEQRPAQDGTLRFNPSPVTDHSMSAGTRNSAMQPSSSVSASNSQQQQQPQQVWVVSSHSNRTRANVRRNYDDDPEDLHSSMSISSSSTSSSPSVAHSRITLPKRNNTSSTHSCITLPRNNTTN